MVVGVSAVLLVGGYLGYNYLRDSGKAFFQKFRGNAVEPGAPVKARSETVTEVAETGSPSWTKPDRLYEHVAQSRQQARQ
jgi:hypothetical protein